MSLGSIKAADKLCPLKKRKIAYQAKESTVLSKELQSLLIPLM